MTWGNVIVLLFIALTASAQTTDEGWGYIILIAFIVALVWAGVGAMTHRPPKK